MFHAVCVELFRLSITEFLFLIRFRLVFALLAPTTILFHSAADSAIFAHICLYLYLSSFLRIPYALSCLLCCCFSLYFRLRLFFATSNGTKRTYYIQALRCVYLLLFHSSAQCMYAESMHSTHASTVACFTANTHTH